MREREAEGRAGCGQGRDRVAGGQNPGTEGMQNRSPLQQTGEGILVLSGLQDSVWIFLSKKKRILHGSAVHVRIHVFAVCTDTRVNVRVHEK